MPPTKTNEQVLAESTAVAQTAAKTIGGTFEQGRGFTPGNTNIPAPVVDGNNPALNIPEANITVPSVDSVRSSGVPILDADRAEKEAAVATAEAPVTEGESRIRELMGLTGQKSAVNAQLRQEKGVTEASALVSSLVNSLRTQQANLADNDDIFEDSVQMQRMQAAGQDITKRTFGAMETEMRINRAIDRRSQMAGIRATQASYYVATENLEAAKAEVKEALDLIYDPIEQELQMESFFLQRNDVRLSDARRELATAKGREIDFKLGEITRARSMVDAAVATGMAGPGEINEMIAIEDPVEQANYARNILGRSAAEERWYKNAMNDMQMANIRDQIASRNRAFEAALISEEAESEEKRKATTEKSLEIMTLAKELMADPGLKTAVGPNRLARLGGGWSGKDARFEAKANRLSNLLTIDNLKLMSGVLSDSDIKILQSAGSVLSGYESQGWAVREKDVISEFNRLISVAERNIGNNGIDAEQAVYWGMATPEDISVFNQVWGDETLTTSSFNPSQYYAQ